MQASLFYRNYAIKWFVYKSFNEIVYTHLLDMSEDMPFSKIHPHLNHITALGQMHQRDKTLHCEGLSKTDNFSVIDFFSDSVLYKINQNSILCDDRSWFTQVV